MRTYLADRPACLTMKPRACMACANECDVHGGGSEKARIGDTLRLNNNNNTELQTDKQTADTAATIIIHRSTRRSTRIALSINAKPPTECNRRLQ